MSGFFKPNSLSNVPMIPMYCLTKEALRDLAENAAYKQILKVVVRTDGKPMNKQNLI